MSNSLRLHDCSTPDFPVLHCLLEFALSCPLSRWCPPIISLSVAPSSHWWLSGKEPTCQYRRGGFDPWVGKVPWRRMDRGAWWAVVHGVAESDTIWQLNNNNPNTSTVLKCKTFENRKNSIYCYIPVSSIVMKSSRWLLSVHSQLQSSFVFQSMVK